MPGTGAPDDPVTRIRWMVEELRVGLFAQVIGTPRPVSEQRVYKAIDRSSPEEGSARTEDLEGGQVSSVRRGSANAGRRAAGRRRRTRLGRRALWLLLPVLLYPLYWSVLRLVPRLVAGR